MRAFARAFSDDDRRRFKLPANWPKYVPLTMVLLEDNPFHDDVLCVFLLRPSRREEGFVVMPRCHVSDVNLSRPTGVLMCYDHWRPGDRGPVAFTVFHNGRVEINSEQRGRKMSWFLPLLVSTSGEERVSGSLLERAAKIPTTDFLGFGRAKVLSAVQMEPD